MYFWFWQHLGTLELRSFRRKKTYFYSLPHCNLVCDISSLNHVLFFFFLSFQLVVKSSVNPSKYELIINPRFPPVIRIHHNAFALNRTSYEVHDCSHLGSTGHFQAILPRKIVSVGLWTQKKLSLLVKGKSFTRSATEENIWGKREG